MQQNSSLDAILEILKPLEKGTKEVMHKAVLLATENQDL
jgi:hypothetical protein